MAASRPKPPGDRRIEPKGPFGHLLRDALEPRNGRGQLSYAGAVERINRIAKLQDGKSAGYSTATIRNWIGRWVIPSHLTLGWIAEALEIPLQDVIDAAAASYDERHKLRHGQPDAAVTAVTPTCDLVPASPPLIVPSDPPPPSDNVATAELLLSVRATVLPSHHHLELIRRSLNDAISDGTTTDAALKDWEQTVLDHGRATRDHPPAVMLADLTADLIELQRAVAGCRSASAMRRLTRVTAQMAGLICLTLVKLDERDGFRKWARTARIAAQEIGDPATHSWVRAQEAYGHYYSGDLMLAIQVAHDAQDSTAQSHSVGASLAAALEARAYAALGDERSTQAALNRAESILARLDRQALVPSAFGYSESQLRFHEGSAYTHLHNTSAAWKAQERALALCPPGDYTDRALTQLDRATCLAHDGDITGATTYTLQALDGLTNDQRRGIINLRARSVVAALPPHIEALPAARDLHELVTTPTDEEDTTS